jgi:hypothetical protein
MSFQMKLNLWLTGGFLLADPAVAGAFRERVTPNEKARRGAPGFWIDLPSKEDRP